MVWGCCRDFVLFEGFCCFFAHFLGLFSACFLVLLFGAFFGPSFLHIFFGPAFLRVFFGAQSRHGSGVWLGVMAWRRVGCKCLS